MVFSDTWIFNNFLWTIVWTSHSVFKFYLGKNCTKQCKTNLQQFPAIIINVSEFFCMAMQTSYERYSYHILLVTCFWARQKCMLVSLYLVERKYIIIHKKEIPSISPVEFWCVTQTKDYFQKASAYETNVDYQMWSFWYNLLLSYADNMHTHIPTAKNEIFGFKKLKNA